MNDGGEFKKSYSNLYPEKPQLSIENTDKYEASFFYLGIKIMDGKFCFHLFD